VEKALIDTDIWLDIVKGVHPRVRERAEVYWNTFGQFTLSAITVAEVVRGLAKRQQVEALAQWRAQMEGLEILPIDWAVGDLAGELYARLDGGHAHRTLGSADSGDGVVSSAGVGVSKCASLCACGGGGLSPAHSELAGGGIEARLTIDRPTPRTAATC